MMKKLLILSIVVVVISCKGFKDASLSVEQPLVQLDSAEMNPPAIAVLQYNEGIFYNGKTDLSRWQLSHPNIAMERKDSSMVLKLSDVGADWEEMSIRFKPLDFSEAQVLMVRARLDENSRDSLKIRIDLIDEDGYTTNYNLKEHYIRSKPHYKIYKFDYHGAWTQGWPVSAKVNPKRIVGFRVNFNGGGANYTGKLYISEIVASSGKRIITNPGNYPLDDFSEGVSNWWQGGKLLASADEVNDKDVMKLTCEKVGPGWESIGYKLNEAIDFSKTPVLRVRLKANNTGVLRIDLEDAKGTTTDSQPVIKAFSASSGFVDLYYDFTGRFKQVYPTVKDVDPAQIKVVKCFINPPQPQRNPPFTGIVWIDEMALLSQEEYSKLIK